VIERRIDDKTVHRTVGSVIGRNVVTAKQAREAHIEVSAALQKGADPLTAKRAKRTAEKVDSITLKSALKSDVKTKRRGKDGLPLKERTQADYLAMIEPAGTTQTGRPTQAGELASSPTSPSTS